jgi:hypothetical protein
MGQKGLECRVGFHCACAAATAKRGGCPALDQMSSPLVYCYGNGYDAPQIAVRGDGAVFISEPTNNGYPPFGSYSIPPSTSTINGVTINVQCCMGPPMLNSDGTVYVEYEVRNIGDIGITSDTLYLFQVPLNGLYSSTVLSSTARNQALLPGPIIPDGQRGIIATWTISPSNPPVPQYPGSALSSSHQISGFSIQRG